MRPSKSPGDNLAVSILMLIALGLAIYIIVR